VFRVCVLRPDPTTRRSEPLESRLLTFHAMDGGGVSGGAVDC
jgi:hypothetical protein